ncbi:MAG: hypothetical protein HY427_02095 [Candidatus Levybacteria bacterium]|nr:hypothetical protein [Candidatus Levybacteria bacterium]
MTVFFTLLFSIIFSHVFNLPPFRITNDMAAPERFEKKAKIQETEQLNFIHYTSRTRELLGKIPDSNLLSFRCSDGIIRTPQGVYVLENEKTPLEHLRRVQNQDFIDFMRSKESSLPPGMKILSARACELEDNTLLLFYTIGFYYAREADSLTAELVVLTSSDNKAYVEVIKGGFFAKETMLRVRESKEHTRCDNLFQVTRDNMLYILCDERKDFISNYLVYKFNLKNGLYEILEECVNEFENGIKASCK